jgi:plastocyanin
MNQNTPDNPAHSPHHLKLWSSHAKLAIAIASAVILLSIAAAISYHRSNHSALNPKDQAIVSITNQGFSPSTLLVKPGTAVTWTNSDSQPHEVAADPYPKNNSIPGFDSTQVLQAHDSYSFKFEKSGTYHYHDQLNPLKLLGTVTVK